MQRLTPHSSAEVAPRTLHVASYLRGLGQKLQREMAVHDWMVIVYNTILLLVAWQGAHGEQRDRCLARLGPTLPFVILTIVVVRGGYLRVHPLTPLLYRVAVYGSVQLSYFVLRDLLAIASDRRLDDALYRLDLRLFGVEPTLWADRFVTPHATEWFAFFYFNYFSLMAVHVIPFVFFSRRMKLFSEFAFGLLVLVAGGHLIYMLVPGYGPYRYLAPLYQHKLPSGFWYDLVWDAVSSNGALLDIFPSLHTAIPTFLALFSFRNRDQLPFKYTWPLVALFSVNVIGATIFLRWHYLIDLFAGAALAGGSLAVAVRVRAWEDRRRLAVFAESLVWSPVRGTCSVDGPALASAPEPSPLS